MNFNFFVKSFEIDKYIQNYDTIKYSIIKEEYYGIFIYLCFAVFLACLIVALSYLLVTQSMFFE